MNHIEPQTFQDFFSTEYLNQYFQKNLIMRNGGGRDGMAPTVFWNKYQKQIPIIAKKCREGNYHFAIYNEQLILKGRDKLPRVISIPTCLTKRCAPQNRLTIIFAAGIDNNTVVIPSHIKIEQLAYITQS